MDRKIAFYEARGWRVVTYDPKQAVLIKANIEKRLFLRLGRLKETNNRISNSLVLPVEDDF